MLQLHVEGSVWICFSFAFDLCCSYLRPHKVTVFQDMWKIILIVIAMTTCASTGKLKLSEEVKSYLQEVETVYCSSQGTFILPQNHYNAELP